MFRKYVPQNVFLVKRHLKHRKFIFLISFMLYWKKSSKLILHWCGRTSNPCSQCSLNIVWLISQKKSFEVSCEDCLSNLSALISYCNKKILKNTFDLSFVLFPRLEATSTTIPRSTSPAVSPTTSRTSGLSSTRWPLGTTHSSNGCTQQMRKCQKMNVQDLRFH